MLDGQDNLAQIYHGVEHGDVCVAREILYGYWPCLNLSRVQQVLTPGSGQQRRIGGDPLASVEKSHVGERGVCDMPIFHDKNIVAFVTE